MLSRQIEREQFIAALLENYPETLNGRDNLFKINIKGSLLLKFAQEKRIITRYTKGHSVLFWQKASRLNSKYIDSPLYNVTFLDQLPKNKPMVFDTIVVLDFCPDNCDWNSMLQHWKLLLKPEGRIIFNAFSQSLPEKNSRESCNMDLESVIELANNNHLQVQKTIPYAALVTGDGYNFFLKELEKKSIWLILMTWLTKESELFKLALFIEEELVQNLCLNATSRFFIVLDNINQKAKNLQYYSEELKKENALKTLSLTKTLEYFHLDLANFSTILNQLLIPIKSKSMFYMLLKELVYKFPNYDLKDVLNNENLKFFSKMITANKIDVRSLNIAENWMNGSDPILYNNVNIMDGSAYYVMPELLINHFKVFGDN